MQKNIAESVVGFTRHDHKRCVARGLKQADTYCRLHKLRFTEVRRRTLGILLESHSAVGAYDVLERLKAEGLGSKPPIAYRALGFLLENGFIHRVERLNAYIACSHPGESHDPAFLICTDCKSVAETSISSTSSLLKSAKESGFEIAHTTLEAEGQCPSCQKQADRE
ncbi:transcriptional repressor [Granulosicoccus antarcticus]|uniref:Zinc uptake regulation protein n=1 Tax=Granulosicoccus antarcticus IMCC3135 TaxID=1192854 RepID=A0A2Z2NHM7_9GAMM|nr:transcriptional repressor [Granulosicoccus antarcticus]ASJ70543.1 Zinc uptake regulation protein [Granulosicoccus antarcticus IMCC3135]